MDVLQTRVQTSSAEFQSNRTRMKTLAAELDERLAAARVGGGPKARQRHREQGKLPVRERIERLIDPPSAFFELSPLAAFGMYDNGAPEQPTWSPASAAWPGARSWWSRTMRP